MSEKSSTAGIISAATASRIKAGDDLINAVALTLVAAGAWQVRDSRQPPWHERHLLGFIEERQGIFEVMQLADVFRWSSFETIELAIDHVVKTNDEVLQARHGGDLEWILSASATTRSLAMAFSPETPSQVKPIRRARSEQLVA